MPPSAEDRLRDIIEAIDRIEKMLTNCSQAEFEADIIRRMATERYLEIVCEAARRLPEDLKQQAAHIDWRKMVDFANRLRHAYHETEVGVVWGIINLHLPPLRSFVETRIRDGSN
ncbi:HepT-like ribonuclease domain-containing protein [Rhodopseudomonas palustris]|uniref:DUF86 domain-containing protein n=1 Tax=Rhodopseudomonas palustris TaxID=1076 RepID=A0A418VDY0_RHOPL|nr:HepT-like ribonuclease domain-containing protein [Rhodopseudomonas palustris]RJF74288.1 DUF86 domain-containing protein [Rhodopseudomonas palustris]